MANRLKEDEKNERIIRGLLKLPENRRCVNCNSLGPQYVCVNFWTFICTTCSGIHREFTHRVKSISMAKFTAQEVGALQGGGNQRARVYYFKEWDAQHRSTPDSSNVDRLRDFIKHVYVNKRYTGLKTLEKPPRVKMSDKEEPYENRSIEGFRGPYEDTYDRSYSGRNSPGGRSDDRSSRDSYDGRSPVHEQENRQYDDRRRSPAHPEVVNDWRREDRFGNGRGFEDPKISGEDCKLECRSPDNRKDIGICSPPMTRPVRDILGGNISPQVIEPPKANTYKATDGIAHMQRTASSSSFGSTDGNLHEPKTENLIDFDAEPQPPVTTPVLPAQQTAVQTIFNPKASSSCENWACFDFALPQLATPSAGNGLISSPTMSGASSLEYAPIETFSGVTPVAVSANNSPLVGTHAPASLFQTNDVRKWPSMQHPHHTAFPSPGSQPAAQQYIPSASEPLSDHPWNSSLASNKRGALTPEQPSETVLKLFPETNSVVSESQIQLNTAGRKELPEDLFGTNYSSIPVTPNWQIGPPQGMGFAMQNDTAVVSNSLQPSNPFDLNGESLQAQTSFPSMASFQGAVAPMSAPPSENLLQTSSVASFSPYTLGPLSQPPSYPSTMPSSACMGQQTHGSKGFPPLNPNPELAGRYSALSTANPLSSAGGNPFA